MLSDLPLNSTTNNRSILTTVWQFGILKTVKTCFLGPAFRSMH